jgi:Ca2+-binding EF-hand superfamily protein
LFCRNTGSVTLENFESWIVREEQVLGGGEKLNIRETADAIFDQMDADKGGTISISELMGQLLQWSGSSNFNYEDALDVVKEFNHSNTGELSRHEFYSLLVKITEGELPESEYVLE